MSELPFTGPTQRHRMPHAEIPGCALIQDLIPLYLDGEVTPESHVLMADHLQRCERCSGYFAGARSVQSQILHEERAIHVATAALPTVIQMREPIATSLGVALWQSLMVLFYGMGIFKGLIGFTHEAAGPTSIGALLAAAGLAGLLVVGSSRMTSWLVLMSLTSTFGFMLMVYALVNGTLGPGSVYGIGMIGLGLWGVWLHYTQRPLQAATTATRRLNLGAHQAMVTAFLSVVGAGFCGIAAFAAMLGIVNGGSRGFAGMVLALSLGGIFVIMRQRGWFSTATEWYGKRLLGLMLVGIGLAVQLTILPAGLVFGSTYLPLLGAVGAILLGLRLIGWNVDQPSRS